MSSRRLAFLALSASVLTAAVGLRAEPRRDTAPEAREPKGEPAADSEDGAGANLIVFRVNTDNDKGVVRCGLFRQQGWLKKTVAADIVKIKGRTATCVFRNVTKGVYGVSAFHDEDNDGELDTSIVGYPTEYYCASRNARNTFGPPSFDDAKFRFDGGYKRLSAQMKRWPK